MTNQSADLDWTPEGVPVSRRFDDPYYSNENGLAESRYVFLAGNDLPARFHGGFHIGELGFGTGLNLLAAWQAWQEAGIGGALLYTSFERYPMKRADMARAISRFAELDGLARALFAAWAPGSGEASLPGLRFRLIEGDARQTVPQWSGCADAWFLDGFAPARNPQLWEPALLAEVARHTAPDGTFSTYSAAGHVRAALSRAGFQVERRPGFGRKRHMSVGRMAP